MASNKNTDEKRPPIDSWGNCLLLVLFVFFLFNLWETIHDRWVVERNVSAVGMSQIVDYHGEYIAFGILAMVFAVGIWAWKQRERAWKFIPSFRLGIVLMGTALTATVLGTLVLQNSQPPEYIRVYSAPLFSVFKAVHLTNVFGAWWFLAILVILGVNLILCTVKRKPWSWAKLGFVLTHIGIVVVIIGGLAGGLLTTESFIVLTEGSRTDHAFSSEYLPLVDQMIGERQMEYLRSGMMPPEDELKYLYYVSLLPDNIPEQYRIALGATLELEKFEELYYEDPFIVSLNRKGIRKNVKTGETQESYFNQQETRFDDQRPIVLDGDNGILKIKEFYSNFLREKYLDSAESGNPLAKLTVQTDRMDMIRILAEENWQSPLVFGTLKIRFKWQSPTAEEIEELGLDKGDAPHKVIAYDPEGHRLDEFDLEVGKSQTVGEGPFTVTILEFIPDYHEEESSFTDSSVGVENEESPPESDDEELKGGSPAIKVRVSGGEIEEQILTLSSGIPSPHESPMKEFQEKTGFSLGYAYDPTVDLVIVGEGAREDGEAGVALQTYAHGMPVETKPLEPGEEIYPPETHFTLVFDSVMASAEVKERISNESSKLSPAVKVEVQRDDEILEAWLECVEMAPQMMVMTERERYFLDLDEKWNLTFNVRSDFRKDWRSHVNLFDGDAKIRSHMIKVNEPLVINGNYIYQQSWFPQLPYGQTTNQWFTYLRVVNDPALPIVYLGLAMMVVGIVYTLYVRPRIKRASRKEEDYVE